MVYIFVSWEWQWSLQLKSATGINIKLVLTPKSLAHTVHYWQTYCSLNHRGTVVTQEFPWITATIKQYMSHARNAELANSERFRGREHTSQALWWPSHIIVMLHVLQVIQIKLEANQQKEFILALANSGCERLILELFVFGKMMNMANREFLPTLLLKSIKDCIWLTSAVEL